MSPLCAVAALVLLLAGSACGQGAAPNVAGLQAFQQLALENVNLTQALYEAVSAGDLTEAQEAYAASRAPYEQIEVLAGAFPELDSDIDARAYAFRDGEAFANETQARQNGTTFKGFHRIEALLFRDRNVTAAEWWAAALVNSSVALAQDLAARSSFSASVTWGGMTALASEVAAKKFSSEEETFSDLSILIFQNNFEGIHTQYEAYEEAIIAENDEAHEAVEAALDRVAESVAPFINKPGELGGVTPYSQVSIAARAEIQAAAYALYQALEEAEEYAQLPPEVEEEAEQVCVAKLQAAELDVKPGLAYFRALLPYQLAAARNLTEAIADGNLTAAKVAYARARPYYEQFEVLAPSFAEEDAEIDAREAAFDGGELNDEFQGFHRIERLLFRDGDVGVTTLRYAQTLEEELEEVGSIMNDTSKFTGATNFEGIIGVATEVVAKKISSEEETSSGLSKLIFWNNWKGIYSQVAPFLSEVDPELSAALQDAVSAAADCLNITTDNDILDVNATSVDAAFAASLADADYGNYSDATPAQKECITQAGYQVRDEVIEVARALNALDDCHPQYQSVLHEATPTLTFTEAQDAARVPENLEQLVAESPALAPQPATPAEAPTPAGEAPGPAPASPGNAAPAVYAERAFVFAAGAAAAAWMLC